MAACKPLAGFANVMLAFRCGLSIGKLSPMGPGAQLIGPSDIIVPTHHFMVMLKRACIVGSDPSVLSHILLSRLIMFASNHSPNSSQPSHNSSHEPQMSFWMPPKRKPRFTTGQGHDSRFTTARLHDCTTAVGHDHD